jgi:hypothetical protein
MLKEGGQGFVPLPKERTLHSSPARTSLSIQTPNSYPGKEPLSITNGGGITYITTQRVSCWHNMGHWSSNHLAKLVYLPTTPTTAFQSFSAPILNLLDTHVTAPWFGANAWVAVLKPVTGGGIPPQHAFVELKLTFKDGGAYDFHHVFEELKERVTHAVETARDSGRSADLTDVPFEQLPAYEVTSSHAPVTSPPDGPTIIAPTPVRPGAPSASATQVAPSGGRQAQQIPPDEPPPGYEEAQSSSVMNSLEESVREANS